MALGDSFTEGVGDPDTRLPNGVRGWADRVAEKLAKAEPGWRHANLAVRSKRLREVVTDQLEVTLRLQPTLITLYAGGNDVLDPGTEIRSILDDYEKLVAALTNTGATLLLFTGYDVPLYPVVWLFRRHNHAYHEGVRQIAPKYGATLVDYWMFDQSLWTRDRVVPLLHRKIRRVAFGDWMKPRWPLPVEVPPKGGLRRFVREREESAGD